MPLTHHIFIDYENVSETDFSRIVGKPVRVFMILGANHTKLPTSLFEFLQDHPDQLRILRTPLTGRNALDFVLACELGQLVATEPESYFHIISKDSGFDALVKHLKGKKRLVARHSSLGEIPLLFTTEERLLRLYLNLRDPEKSRPNKRKALEAVIQGNFGRSLSSEIVDKTITDLVHRNIIVMSDTGQISYPASM